MIWVNCDTIHDSSELYLFLFFFHLMSSFDGLKFLTSFEGFALGVGGGGAHHGGIRKKVGGGR